MVTVNITFIRFYQPAIIRLLLNSSYRRITVNFGTQISGPFCQSLGQISWLNIAILWMLNSSD